MIDSYLVSTLRKMYLSKEYKLVDKGRIDSYLKKGLITQEEYNYIIGGKDE